MTNDIDPLADPLLGIAAICEDLGGRTARGIYKAIREGRFPAPDLNVNGINLWRRSTYGKWKSDALAGAFRQDRRPVGGQPGKPQAA
jgi:hypothetical protein